MPSICASLLAAALAVAAAPSARADEPLERFYHPYRADAVEGPDEGVPLVIYPLPSGGPGAWPDAMRDESSARVRDEWPAGRVYGPLQAAVGAWLSYPLVTARVGDRVAIPVIEGSSIPVRGALALPEPMGRRRVVLLIDASSSANAPILFRAPSGRHERITVLES